MAKGTNDDIRQQLQQKYMEVHMLSQQIKQIQQQLQTIDAQLEELDKTAESVNAVKEIKEGTEIFVSLSPGIFVKAKIADTNNLLLNVGVGTGVERPAKDTVELIRSQVTEISEYRENMVEQLELLTRKSAELEKDLQEIGKNV